MTTAQRIFEQAIYLMDEAQDGKIDAGLTADFRSRTLPILNVLRIDCAMGDCPPGLIPNFETPIGLDDEVCQGVLPYGLAAHFLVDENPDKARFFQERYEELRDRYELTRKARFEPIPLPYGGL